MNVYPIFLNNLAAHRCVVIGGGAEAERKVRGLLACAAAVTVISDALTDPLAAWAAEDRIIWIPRDYRPGDLRGALLAIASDADPATAKAVWQEAQDEGVLLNVMDDMPHCTFIAGSVVRQGPLVITISTSGCAPALAVRLRQRFERTFGPEYDTFLDLMRSLRAPMAAQYPDFEERRRRWYALVDSDLLGLLRAGDRDAVHRRLEELVGDEVTADLPVD